MASGSGRRTGFEGIVGARLTFTKGSRELRGPTAFQSRVYATVRLIPPGFVLSYGEVAELVGHPRSARAVGGALAHTPETLELPWWRVVSGRGVISTPNIRHTANVQRALLEDEGIAFSPGGSLDWDRFGWTPNAEAIAKTLETLPT